MAASISSERQTVRREEPFVVFLIGARANKLWNLPVLWGVGRAMTRMLNELAADPESGLLSFENYGGRTTLAVQYWESVEHLHQYSRDREREHQPAWKRWVKDWGKGAVGIWHETYVIDPGNYETIYHHMPKFGLGKVGPLVGATADLETSAGRLEAVASA